MNILTGNDLATGDVIWWTGEGWSRHVDDAVDVGDKGTEIAQVELAARHVNEAYVVDAAQTADGIRPTHIKERIRALGPTVRLDLSLKPADPTAGNWVI
jgi:hypothetical protein